MIWAAICLAFFGFLRISEFTCEGPYHPSNNLSSTDIMLRRHFLKLTLKASKADPFRQGITLTIAALESKLCPVRALQNYLTLCPAESHHRPLFRYRSGKTLTRCELTKEIRLLLSQAGFKATEFAGHSFRIRVATAAAKANIQPWLIKNMGRWTSDCFEGYIRTPDDVLINATKQMIANR